MSTPAPALIPADRRRGRLWALGPAALTTAELLAILIGTGSGGAGKLEVAGRLRDVGEGSLRRLAQRLSAELLQALGTGGRRPPVFKADCGTWGC